MSLHLPLLIKTDETDEQHQKRLKEFVDENKLLQFIKENKIIYTIDNYKGHKYYIFLINRKFIKNLSPKEKEGWEMFENKFKLKRTSRDEWYNHFLYEYNNIEEMLKEYRIEYIERWWDNPIISH